MLQETNTQERTILIVDDDRDIGDALYNIISQETSYRAMWVAESDVALLSAPLVRPAAILLDYLMPVMNGLRLYDRLQEIEVTRGVPVILITAAQLLPTEEIQQRGIYLLKKPFEITVLLDLLHHVLPE